MGDSKPKDDAPRPVAGLNPRALPIGPEEAFVLSRIDGRSRSNDLSLATGLSVARVEEILARLATLGAVTGVAAREVPPPTAKERPGGAVPPLDEVPAEDVDLAPAQQRDIRLLHTMLPTLTHYDLLGVRQDAPWKEIKRAYFSIVGNYHPDRYFRRRLGSYEEKLEAIFERLMVASDTLGNEELRATYDLSLAPGAVGPREALPHIKAATREAQAPREEHRPLVPKTPPRGTVPGAARVTPDRAPQAATPGSGLQRPPEPPSKPGATLTTGGIARKTGTSGTQAPVAATKSAAIDSSARERDLMRRTSPKPPPPHPATPRASTSDRATPSATTGKPVRASSSSPPRASGPPPSTRLGAHSPSTRPFEVAPRPSSIPPSTDGRRAAFARKLTGGSIPPRRPESLRPSAAPSLTSDTPSGIPVVPKAPRAPNILGTGERSPTATRAIDLMRSLRPHDPTIAQRFEASATNSKGDNSKVGELGAEAQRRESAGRYYDAALLYARASELQPELRFYEGAARCFLAASQNLRQAAEYAKKAIELAPKTARFALLLGRIYAAASMTKSAITQLERVLELEPKNAEAQTLLGTLSRSKE